MDGVRKTFDKWAQNGRAELMEIEHGKNVLKFLQTISFDKWSGCPCEQPYVTEVRQLDFLSKTGFERIPSRKCLLFQSQK